MSKRQIDEAVANATGESLAVVRSLGFSVADPMEVSYDPEPRRPMMVDWDSMSPSEWPSW